MPCEPFFGTARSNRDPLSHPVPSAACPGASPTGEPAADRGHRQRDPLPADLSGSRRHFSRCGRPRDQRVLHGLMGPLRILRPCSRETRDRPIRGDRPPRSSPGSLSAGRDSPSPHCRPGLGEIAGAGRAEAGPGGLLDASQTRSLGDSLWDLGEGKIRCATDAAVREIGIMA